jgi:fluoride exporter
MMSFWSLILVFIGGGLGATARFGVGLIVHARNWSESFPWHTWLINVVGSFVLGVIVGMCAERPQWKLFLGVGLCGGFTTFSTFSVETLELLRVNRIGAAVGYVIGSVVTGVVGAWFGLRASRG